MQIVVFNQQTLARALLKVPDSSVYISMSEETVSDLKREGIAKIFQIKCLDYKRTKVLGQRTEM